MNSGIGIATTAASNPNFRSNQDPFGDLQEPRKEHSALPLLYQSDPGKGWIFADRSSGTNDSRIENQKGGKAQHFKRVQTHSVRDAPRSRVEPGRQNTRLLV